MKYKIGDKVYPMKKTSRSDCLKSRFSYKRMKERGQEFMYITGFDMKATKGYGDNCYWCDATKEFGGDSYRESDLRPVK